MKTHRCVPHGWTSARHLTRLAWCLFLPVRAGWCPVASVLRLSTRGDTKHVDVCIRKPTVGESEAAGRRPVGGSDASSFYCYTARVGALENKEEAPHRSGCERISYRIINLNLCSLCSGTRRQTIEYRWPPLCSNFWRVSRADRRPKIYLFSCVS